MSTHVLTVGITTRDRPAALARCLRSLSCISDLAPQVLVFDDASRTSVSVDSHPPGIRTIRDDRGVGYIVGRTGDWNFSFYVTAGFYVIGALCWWFVDPVTTLEEQARRRHA